jgi:signal transduction histidine kinase
MLVAVMGVVGPALLAARLVDTVPVYALVLVYLPGIVVVASTWGVRLGLTMAVTGALAGGLFLTPPMWSSRSALVPWLIVLAILVIVALLCGIQRSRVDELRHVADEQSALRRLATIIAQGAPPSLMFDAVATEMGRVLGTTNIILTRYEPDGTIVAHVGGWGQSDILPRDSRWKIEANTISDLVLKNKAPVRMSAVTGTGPLSTALRQAGVLSRVACPITVGGHLWGTAIAYRTTPEPFPPGTEEKMSAFAELAGIAIANAQSNADLKASRARIVTAADETRRRIERDLHDGAQQRLISLGLAVRVLQATLPEGMERLDNDLNYIAHIADEATSELQEIAHGLHPSAVTKGGLKRTLITLTRHSSVPVELTIDLDRRLPEPLEVSLYYIASEALTNIAKHAQASNAIIDLSVIGTTVQLRVHDDGIGGADTAQGSGLTGLLDRVNSLGGRLDIISPPGQGTTLTAQFPIEANDDLSTGASQF